jgi:hypothetical protein
VVTVLNVRFPVACWLPVIASAPENCGNMHRRATAKTVSPRMVKDVPAMCVRILIAAVSLFVRMGKRMPP